MFFSMVYRLPEWLYYWIYDHLNHWYYKHYKEFFGWGIHLYCGKFGQGKSSLMVIDTYRDCVRYPQLHVLTNINLINFPDHTKIIPLKTADDILNAPDNTIVLIDEIGTLFNSRDFSSGKNSVPKPVFQHLCQCRKRHLMIRATVQRFNLLDKQIRDISATVTECRARGKHPFSRLFTALTYDIDEYEAATTNKMYVPSPCGYKVEIQTDKFRQLYDTSQLIQGLLTKEYLSDEEILRNQGVIDCITTDGSKASNKAFKRAQRRRK